MDLSDPEARALDAERRLLHRLIAACSRNDADELRLDELLDDDGRSRFIVLSLEDLRRLAAAEKDRPTPG